VKWQDPPDALRPDCRRQVTATFAYAIPSWAIKCTATAHITGKGECWHWRDDGADAGGNGR
jgi:hypothetical protein